MHLLGAISCLCFLSVGLQGEECNQGVVARREIFYVPQGGSLSLSCVVQHCGERWTWNWMRKNLTNERFSAITNSDRHHMTDEIVSANETILVLNFLKVNQLDEGSYGCRVTWGHSESDQGHLTYVNVTAAVPSQRKLLHRVLVYAGASLCLPVILGLACCLSSRVKPQPLPRTQPTYAVVYRNQPDPAPQTPPRCPVTQPQGTSSHKAPPKSQQRPEVVYADISKDALSQQSVFRESPQFTVYSSVKFS